MTSKAQPSSSSQPSPPPAPKPTDTRRELFGYLLMICAAVAYTAHNVLIRLAQSRYGMTANSSVLIRAPIQTLLSTLWLSCVRPRLTLVGITTRHATLLLLRGLLGGTALLLLYVAFDRLPVGDATAIFFSTPIFTLVLSHVLLHEPVTPTDILAACLSVCGVLLMTRSSRGEAEEKLDASSVNRLIGIAAAVSSAALTASAYTVVRALGTAVHFMAYVLSMGACAGLIAAVFSSRHSLSYIPASQNHSLGYTISQFSTPEIVNHPTTPLIMAALAGFVAQACTNRSLQLCRAGRATLVRNIEVPLTYAVGTLTLSEKPTLLSGTGATFVLTAAIIVGIRRIMKG